MLAGGKPGDGGGKRSRNASGFGAAAEAAALAEASASTLELLLEEESAAAMEEELELCDGDGLGPMDGDTISGDEDLLAIPPPGKAQPSLGTIGNSWGQRGALSAGGGYSWQKPEKTDADYAGGEELRVAYEPPRAALVVLQTFRLPHGLDQPDWRFQALLPSTDGASLTAVLVKEEGQPNTQPCPASLYCADTNHLTSHRRSGVKFNDRAVLFLNTRSPERSAESVLCKHPEKNPTLKNV